MFNRTIKEEDIARGIDGYTIGSEDGVLGLGGKLGKKEVNHGFFFKKKKDAKTIFEALNNDKSLDEAGFKIIKVKIIMR